MFFSFIELRELLKNWPTSVPAHAECSDGILRRILDILQNPDGLIKQKKDFQALIRQTLGTHKARDGVASLIVTSTNGWPSADEWKTFGLCATPVGDDFRLGIEPWEPEWLPDHSMDILRDIYRGDNCRHLNPVPGDPAMRSATGFETYSSHGQRNAIRSLLFAPLGSTLVVNLPTGSGKSLVGYMPSLLDAEKAI